MRYADVNGASLAYEVSGHGAPIIFVHGFLARSTDGYYEDFKEHLAASCRVYALDMRGHGESAAAADSGLEQCARDLAAFAQLMGLDAPVLVGHSMGALISTLAALLHPERFGMLALLTAAAGKGEPAAEDQVAGFMALRSNPAAMSEWFAGMFMVRPDQSRLDVLREAALRLPNEVAERWMRDEFPKANVVDRLPALRLPVLSLIGARDVVVSPQRQYEEALSLPNAKVVTFTGGGHMIPLEQPECCAREILRFMGDGTG